MKLQFIKEREFQLPGLRLKAKEWGQAGGLPVLALHGWMDNANTFDRLLPEMEGLHVIALDLAGHGLSEHRPPGGSYYLWDHLEDVAAVVRQLGWKRFSLLGHSMGAGIATWYAGTFPAQIERMALIDGFGAAFSVETNKLPAYLNRAVRRRQMAEKVPLQRFSAQETAQFASFEDAVAERQNGKFGQLSAEAARLLLKRGLLAVEGGFRWRNDPRLTLPALMEPDEASIAAFIKRVTAPVCLVLGDQGLFAQGQKQHRLNHFQHLEQHTLPGGHHLHLEAVAPRIAQLLQSFFISSLQPQTQSL